MTAGKCVLVDNERGLEDMLKMNERVIALFHASWCPFCVDFLPLFKKCAQGSPGLEFLIVRDDEETLVDGYKVEIVPTVLYFKNGKIARRLDGTPGVGLNEKQLTQFIQTCAR